MHSHHEPWNQGAERVLLRQVSFRRCISVSLVDTVPFPSRQGGTTPKRSRRTFLSLLLYRQTSILWLNTASPQDTRQTAAACWSLSIQE